MHASRRLTTTTPAIRSLCSFRTPLASRLVSRSSPIAAFPRAPFISVPTRAMSSGPTTTKEWLVILPDKPDSIERRLAVRPAHLAAANEKVAQGLINFGGVMLHEHITEGETPKFKGSIMLFQVETKEEVLDIIKSDKYVENDVWDLEKVEIYPFKSAVRKAL